MRKKDKERQRIANKFSITLVNDDQIVQFRTLNLSDPDSMAIIAKSMKYVFIS